MKKLAWLSVAFATFLFTACDKKENSYNFAQILYPGLAGSVIYADQTLDSIKFATTYDWSLSCTADWLHINPDSAMGTVPSGYYLVKKIILKTDVNLTDTVRSTLINFHADGKVLVSGYTQLHYLNIERPVRERYEFVLTDTARQEKDSIMFRTYGDWTLEFDGEAPTWVRCKEGSPTSGTAGAHKVCYTLDENKTTEPRTAIVNLKSKGVTTKIKIKQLSPKK